MHCKDVPKLDSFDGVAVVRIVTKKTPHLFPRKICPQPVPLTLSAYKYSHVEVATPVAGSCKCHVSEFDLPLRAGERDRRGRIVAVSAGEGSKNRWDPDTDWGMNGRGDSIVDERDSLLNG
ncbi:hypothetical protein NW754_015040 [Fusarium falciforme]|uniref:Uncharacterized protein n=1 Tax=Fusarium falciforme TaxID=195108 RepID=A0A9W8UTR3_9HYPO|nr:hypothetical protein NW754_015040 [Fusarium falciforme]KAJ4177850.1 hypothetical protein NW755_013612 [Fusarium falciforme]KAJ4234153.1 hypothetical protein NW757_013638 [Fusarium falciforme]